MWVFALALPAQTPTTSPQLRKTNFYISSQEQNMAKKKKTPSKREQRRIRTTQIIFAIIAGMIILSMLISFIRF
jgi:hypothetical protein